MLRRQENLSTLILAGVVIFLISLLLDNAYAQPTAQTTASVESQSEKSWALGISLSQSSNLKPRDDDEFEASTDIEINPSYAFKYLSAAAYLSATQNLHDDREHNLNDSRLVLSGKAQDLGNSFSFSYPATFIFPTSKASREERSLRLGSSIRPTLHFDFKKIGLKGLKAFYGLALSKNIHAYDTAADGSSNNSYGITNVVNLSLNILKDLDFSATFSQRNNFSYQNYLRQSFRHDEELSYSLTEMLSVAVGHSNEGSALKANGAENASYFDRNKSQVYLSLSANF